MVRVSNETIQAQATPEPKRLLGGCPWKAPAMQSRGPGVYLISNSIDGRVYVGSSAKSIRERWNVHRHHLRHGKHGNRFLQRAWKKRGESAFSFSVLLRCSREWCLALEQLNICRLSSTKCSHGYNLAPNAGSALGVKRSAEWCRNNSERQIGKKKSLEFCQKMRASMNRRMADPAQRRAILSALAKGASDEASRRADEGKRRYWKNPNPEHVAKLRRAAFSPEVNAKRSAAMRGRVFSESHKAKIGEANRRRVFTPEMRLNMSVSAKLRCANPEESARMAAIGSIVRKSIPA